MNYLYKLEQKFGKYAIKNISLILVCCYAAGYMIEMVNPDFLNYITLNPYLIMHGQVWRLVSWLLVPPNQSNILFVAIMLFFYYSIGTTLERTWGTFQYNLYLFAGLFFTILGSFLYILFASIVYPQIDIEVTSKIVAVFFSTYYVNMSIFLAFAATFPENQVLLMFIIPIKVKWLGIVYAVVLVFDMISSASSSLGATPFVIASSLLNFILFFLTTRNYIKMNRNQRKKHREFRKHVKKQSYSKVVGITKHKCAVCGRTELDGDDLEFRFCSKCNGNYEYCQDHLYTHVHRE